MDEQSLASVNWFPVQLPRLYDLYDRSDKSHPDNYFTNFSATRAEMFLKTIFQPMEERLQKLDTEAWKQLVEKTLDSVTTKLIRAQANNASETRPSRFWAPLYDFLNEARGYALLADRGYQKISFIDCNCQDKKKQRKSPDLLGESQSSTAILEVKTINESDKDLEWKERNQSQTRTVTGLSAEFRKKLSSTIAKASAQLNAYPKPVDKKIVLLLIRFDMDNILEASNYTTLQAMIETIQISGLDIVHDVI